MSTCLEIGLAHGIKLENDMESKHTPGPWEAVDGYRGRGFDVFTKWLDDPPKFKTGKRVGQDKREPRSVPIAIDVSYGGAITNIFDAFLIAAAPDLLAACRAALASIEADADGYPDRAVADLLRAAIAKAEGRTHA